eukprot:6672773-Pyramimonas_sp.AAC.1
MARRAALSSRRCRRWAPPAAPAATNWQSSCGLRPMAFLCLRRSSRPRTPGPPSAWAAQRRRRRRPRTLAP